MVNPIKINTREKIALKLNQNDIYDRAINSCKVAAELEDLQRQATAIKTDWKKRMEAVESKLKSLHSCVQSGEEWREVDCQRAFDLQRGVTWIEFENRKYPERPATQKEIELLQQGTLDDFLDEDND